MAFQQEIARDAFGRVEFGMDERDHERLAQLCEIAKLMPGRQGLRVRAHEPARSNREDAYRLSEGLWDTESLLFDLGETRDDEKDTVRPVLRDKGFGVVARRGRFVLAQRGAPPDRNRQVIRSMH